MKYLFALLFSITSILSFSQKLTKADIVGTYHMESASEGGLKLFLSNDPSVTQNLALKKLATEKPDFTPEDSILAISKANFTYNMSKNLTIEFNQSGEVFNRTNDSLLSTNKWIFDYLKQIVLIGGTDDFVPTKQNNKITLVHNNKEHGAIIELIKD